MPLSTAPTIAREDPSTEGSASASAADVGLQRTIRFPDEEPRASQLQIWEYTLNAIQNASTRKERVSSRLVCIHENKEDDEKFA